MTDWTSWVPWEGPVYAPVIAAEWPLAFAPLHFSFLPYPLSLPHLSPSPRLFRFGEPTVADSSRVKLLLEQSFSSV